MSAIGPAVVASARSWIGTPYRHQASTKGAGTDCLGLLRGIWRTLYGAEPELVPPYTADWSEAERDEVLLRAALRHLDLAQKAAVGQVLLFRMRNGAAAKHLGIQSATTPAKFIHAYSGHGVVENSLTAPWQRRVVARFNFPERTF